MFILTDFILLVPHFLLSLVIVSPLNALIISIFMALWYTFIDRGLLNIILVIPTRIVWVTILKNESHVPLSIGKKMEFVIEVVKAPISAFIAMLLISQFITGNGAMISVWLGLIIWIVNFHYIGGVFKEHPYRTPMFLLASLGTTIVLAIFIW